MTNPEIKNQNLPLGVKIIAVLYSIAGYLAVLAGIAFSIGGGIIMGNIALGGISLIIFGIVLLMLGLLGIFIGRGLWKSKKWARIVALIFSTVAFIQAAFSVSYMSNFNLNFLFSLILNGAIGSYLIFNKKVREIFS